MARSIYFPRVRFSSYTNPQFENCVEQMLQSSSLFDESIAEQTRSIIESVSRRGDRALIELTRRFDGASLSAKNLRVSSKELSQIRPSSAMIPSAMESAIQNIRAFCQASKRNNWKIKNTHAAHVGEQFDPLERVGIYIPGGKAPLISTALMTLTLAKVAGCPQLVACTPCDSKGQIHPDLLFALRELGANEVYRIGGAQAIAAMALGTKSIAPVNKIFGPGNAYVVAAKRLLFGNVAIDLLPGPSELLIIADDSAKPNWIAADLIAQAEHGSGHERVVLLSPSKKIHEAVDQSIQNQISKRARSAFIQKALRANGWAFCVADLDQAVAIANRFAPEHCEIMTRTNRQIARHITTAGAIFLGDYSPTVLGDYVAGPSHVLPTGGGGRGFSGLTVDQFQRRTSIIQYSKTSLKKALASVSAFAQMEGLDGHGYSAKIRFENPDAK